MRAAVAQIKIKEYSAILGRWVGWHRYEGEVNQDWKYHEGEVNQDGRNHGKGVLSYPNGDRYVGEWRNNYRHGHGTMTYADGRVESGQWNGNFLG